MEEAIKKIQEDYRAIKNPKAIRVDELNQLGYLVTKKEVNLIAPTMGNKATFQLVEVVYADNQIRQASFCYLFHIRNNNGYILPRSYRDYIDDTEERPVWTGGTK